MLVSVRNQWVKEWVKEHSPTALAITKIFQNITQTHKLRDAPATTIIPVEEPPRFADLDSTS